MTVQGKKSGKGLQRLINALGWSMAGLRTAVRSEAAFRQELVLVLLLAPLGVWLGHNGVERSLLLGSLLLILIVELLNSAIETVVDRVGLEHHPLSGQAKDIGSAAVLLALANSALIWGFILLS